MIPETGTPIIQASSAYVSLIDLFFKDQRDDFDYCLTKVPAAERASFLKNMIDEVLKCKDGPEAMILIRHMGHVPEFKNLFQQLPSKREQQIYFVNQPFLKTRVSMSFLHHPQWINRPIDYSILVMDQEGKEVYRDLRTIKINETHNFYLDEILKDLPHVSHGKLIALSSELDLGSLRVFAYWYNDQSVTTTHEKGAYSNASQLVIYPTIVIDNEYDTFIGISNLSKQEMEMSFYLKNYLNERSAEQINLKFNPEASVFLPLGHFMPQLKDFLGGQPGSLYVIQMNPSAMHYYFIHNRRLNSWQAQHM